MHAKKEDYDLVITQYKLTNKQAQDLINKGYYFDKNGNKMKMKWDTLLRKFVVEQLIDCPNFDDGDNEDDYDLSPW